jgi:tetratricopeptide (TPR) repeat protein
MRVRRGNQFYAIKFPHEQSSAHWSKRLRREAIALARARHPALPAVLEIGEADGVPYFLMELAAGETLAERLERALLSEDQIVALAKQLAGALRQVHKSGLVHADIKPEHIVFLPDGAVRLVDFGFATDLEGRATAASFGGTPGYAAPEQLASANPRVDGRTDLYSLGRVLRACAFGINPTETSAAPSGQGPRSLRIAKPFPALSQEFSAIIARLLAEDPDDRFSSAEELLAALEAHENRNTPRTSSMRPTARAARSLATRSLFGRTREIKQLRRAWSDARAGDGQILVVRGAAGSGKTHLVRALVAELAADNTVVLTAESHTWDPRPFSGVRQLFRAYLDRLAQRPESEQRSALSAVRDLAGDLAPLVKVSVSDFAEVFADAGPLPTTDDNQHIVIEGTAEFLVRFLRAQPSALVFADDVQWLDGASRSVLVCAARRVQETSTLFVFASRMGAEHDAALSPLLSNLPQRATDEMQLGPLSSSEVDELLSDYLGGGTAEPDLGRAVTALSDGTPLSALEVCRTLLDGGALSPHWGTWKLSRERLEKLELPPETVTVLERRIGELSEETQDLLSAAAVLGPAFQDSLLLSVCHLTQAQAGAALREARQALLIASGPKKTTRFVHDCVREALVRKLSDEARRELHQRTAQAIEGLRAAATEGVYDLAAHYAEGVLERAPSKAYAANREAGTLAIANYDNERAIRCFSAAERAAAVSPAVELDADFHALFGQALLQTGLLEEARVRLRAACDLSRDPLQRAKAESDLAWSYEVQMDSESAWHALERAFQALGEPVPKGRPVDIARSLLLRGRKDRRDRGEAGRRRLETLSHLYIRAGRLAFYDNRLPAMIEAVVLGLACAEKVGSSAVLSRSLLLAAFVLAALGLKSRSRRVQARAEQIARELDDPMAIAHCYQVGSVISAWSGDIRAAVEAGEQCLGQYGHWREFADYWSSAVNQQLIEGIRGNNLKAWRWVERALSKVHTHPVRPMVPEFVLLCARATLVSLGRESEAPELLRGFEQACVPVTKESAFYLYTYGSRAREFTERGILGLDFESLVSEFNAAKLNPRRVHLAVTEYYVHIAHARVHQCLHSSDADRPAALEKLKAAARDIRLAARIPLLKAHSLAIDGYVALFDKEHERARKLFSEAEALGEREGCPWVIYAVSRGKAHLARAEGHEDAAAHHARLAWEVAKSQASAYRMRWVSEEFGLVTSLSQNFEGRRTRSVERTTVRHRGTLRALLRVSDPTADPLSESEVYPAILDELVQAFQCHRGVLYLETEDRTLVPVSGRDARGRDLEPLPPFDPTGPLSGALESRRALVEDDTETLRSLAGAPVLRDGKMVGLIALEALGCGVFGPGELKAFEALSIQAGLTLQLASVLRSQPGVERAERARDELEAVKEFAGTVARDLDVMVRGIYSTLDSCWLPIPEEQRKVLSSTERARMFVDQLFAFSQRRSGTPEKTDLNQLVTELEPALRRVIRSPVTLSFTFDPDLQPVKVDASYIEQFLLSLAVCARQAMGGSGTLVIQTANTELDEDAVGGIGHATPGAYAMITVTSNTSSSPDQNGRSTPALEAAGAWLIQAGAILIQSFGGCVSLHREPLLGTTFSVCLPGYPSSAPRLTRDPPSAQVVGSTLLLVGQQLTSQKSLISDLESRGHHILCVKDPAQVAPVVRDHQGEIRLAICETTLATAAIVRSIPSAIPGCKVLFVSGHARPFLEHWGLLPEGASFLQRPMSSALLISRVRQLLTTAEPGAAEQSA